MVRVFNMEAAEDCVPERRVEAADVGVKLVYGSEPLFCDEVVCDRSEAEVIVREVLWRIDAEALAFADELIQLAHVVAVVFICVTIEQRLFEFVEGFGRVGVFGECLPEVLEVRFDEGDYVVFALFRIGDARSGEEPLYLREEPRQRMRRGGVEGWRRAVAFKRHKRFIGHGRI